MRSAYLEQNSGSFWQEGHTWISEKIGVTSSNSATLGTEGECFAIPATTYVTRIAVLGRSAVAGADFDIGDGTDADQFIDGITTLASGDIIYQNVAPGAGAAEISGKYYTSATWIRITINATATSGTIQVLGWGYTKALE